jgi:hypothetical protein
VDNENVFCSRRMLRVVQDILLQRICYGNSSRGTRSFFYSRYGHIKCERYWIVVLQAKSKWNVRVSRMVDTITCRDNLFNRFSNASLDKSAGRFTAGTSALPSSSFTNCTTMLVDGNSGSLTGSGMP